MQLDASPPSLLTVQSIDPIALFRLLANGGVLVVDVREPDETERSIRGAMRIPLHRLFAHRTDLLAHASKLVVAVSNTGARSREAAFTLHLLGVPDARSLEGGLDAWKRSDLPLE